MINEQAHNLNDDSIIRTALNILEKRMTYGTNAPALTSPEDSKHYVKLQMSSYEHEVFACLFVDNRHRVISFDKLFHGTIDSATVYPREVVKACLKHNAAAVIFAHNHPSGDAEPSTADRTITKRLKQALELIDVRVLDHLVIGSEVVSFAERGIL
jgi:DNA repair protein RadC